MLLKSLKIINFRQFKGETLVDFSCDSEKNVTIILGDNTFGKTTLLQAFNWCFYETVMFDKDPEFLLNLEIEASMKNGDTSQVEVEIVLVHNNTEYIITRCQEYLSTNSKVVGSQPVVKLSYRQPDGQTEAVKPAQIDNVINNILPKDLSTYFFFDTERIRSISTKKDVADAVKGLLGLSVMENAIKHLGTRTTKTRVIGKFYGAMDLEGDQRAQEAMLRIQDAQSKREIVEEQLETCVSEINYYEGKKEQLDAILRDNEATTVLQKKKESIEHSIKMEEEAQNKIKEIFIKDFNYNSINFFSHPLLKQASDFIHEVKVDDKGIKDLTASSIQEIIKRGRCICGCEVTSGNPAYENLMNELSFVPPESIGTTIRNFKEKLKSFGEPSERTYDSIKNRYEELIRSKTRVQEWLDEVEEISTKIKGKGSMRQNEENLIDVKNRLRDFQNKKERLIREDEAAKRDIEKYQKICDSLVAVSDKNKSAMRHIMYAEKILEWLTSSYHEKADYIREELETRVNGVFEKMYHGHRRVTIDSKYQVSLLSTVGDKEIDTGESEGSNRVKNFAFIAGLVSLAKEKVTTTSGEDEINLSSEPYPLVMDAPFSNADETHTRNISKVLPEIAEQVIMFVMQKDWTYAEPVMSNRVGKKYLLNKQSETFTILKGV